jgi:transposase
LFEIAKELTIIPKKSKSSEWKLDALKELLKGHPAFKEETKLEELARKYSIKIIYLPKFHCELSPIEGV